MKLTKAIWASLPAATQAAFTQVGDTDEYDNGEEAVGGLKTALQKERDAVKEAKATLKAVETERDDLQTLIDTGADKGKADVTALTASWQKKMDKATLDHTAAIQKRDTALRNLLVTNEARKIAAELATPDSVDLLERFVRDRLDADIDGDMPSTRVLDAAGKPSASTIDDLKKEILADKRFGGILVGSRASGGGAGGSKPGAGGFKLEDYKSADGSTNWGKVNEANIATPGVLKQVTEALNIAIPGADKAPVIS